MKDKGRNMGASARHRLLALAKERGWEFHRVLTRYGAGRLLSVAPCREVRRALRCGFNRRSGIRRARAKWAGLADFWATR